MIAPLSDADCDDYLTHAERDPAWWVDSMLGVRLWSKQAEVLNAIFAHKRVTVKTCNGIGKSFLGACATLAYGTIYPASFVLTTATKFTQVREVMWREIAKLLQARNADLGIVDALQTQLRWDTGSVAIGLTAPPNEPSKMQGFRARKMLTIVDEAAGVSMALFEGMTSMLTADGAHMLLIGNPTDGAGEFGRAFKSQHYVKFSIAAFDTPNFVAFDIKEPDIASGEWVRKMDGRSLPAPWLITPEWVAQAYHDWGPSDPRYQSRVLAIFPSETPDTLISMALIEHAFASDLTPDTPAIPNELGVDVARYGSDASCIAHRKGAVGRIYRLINGHDTQEVAGAIIRAVRDTGATAVKIDEIGVGAGVVDALKHSDEMRATRASVHGINVGERAKDPEQYANLRAEIFWNLRERAEKHDIVLLRDDDLATELNAIRYKITPRGQIQLEPKEDTKRRIDRSPDRADAMALAFAAAQKRKIVIV
jgi:hypothetical protein